MVRPWTAWAVCVALAASACGGRALDRGDAENHTGSSSGGSTNNGGSLEPPSAGATSTPTSLVPSEWNVNVLFKLQSSPQHIVDAPNCGNVALTLDLLDESGTLRLILGGDGSQAEPFAPIATNDSIQLTAPLSYRPTRGPCSLAVHGDLEYAFDTKELRAVDADHDGKFDHIEGSGDGYANYFIGTSVDRTPFTFALNGVPDDTPPTVSGGTAESNPLDGIVLAVSEPLKTEKLFLEGDSTIPMTDLGVGTLAPNQPLPFGQTWHVAGSAADYAGLPLKKTDATFSTVKDPGLFAQDGFEGPLAGLLTGGARIIDQSYGIAVTGTRALFIPPGATATLRLANPGHGDRHLAFELTKLLAEPNTVDRGSDFYEVIADDGSSTTSSPAMDEPTTPVNIGQWPVIDATTSVVTPSMPAAPGYAVRFKIACVDNSCPPVALVIDDLKLQ